MKSPLVFGNLRRVNSMDTCEQRFKELQNVPKKEFVFESKEKSFKPVVIRSKPSIFLNEEKMKKFSNNKRNPLADISLYTLADIKIPDEKNPYNKECLVNVKLNTNRNRIQSNDYFSNSTKSSQKNEETKNVDKTIFEKKFKQIDNLIRKNANVLTTKIAQLTYKQEKQKNVDREALINYLMNFTTLLYNAVEENNTQKLQKSIEKMKKTIYVGKMPENIEFLRDNVIFLANEKNDVLNNIKKC